jgi:hypothetical protein
MIFIIVAKMRTVKVRLVPGARLVCCSTTENQRLSKAVSYAQYFSIIVFNDVCGYCILYHLFCVCASPALKINCIEFKGHAILIFRTHGKTFINRGSYLLTKVITFPYN